MPHADADCEDCGVHHLPWSAHDAERARREAAEHEGMAPVAELYPGALADRRRTEANEQDR